MKDERCRDNFAACVICDGGLPTVTWDTERERSVVRASVNVCGACQSEVSDYIVREWLCKKVENALAEALLEESSHERRHT